MADNINRDSIDDIVSGVKEALRSGESIEGGVSLEFFEEDETGVALVFEDEESDAEPEAESETEPEQDIAEPFLTPKEEKEDEKTIAPQDKIWTTYVPRFTSASDNYRVRKNDEFSVPTSYEEKKTQLDTPVFFSDSDEAEVDPTAELDSEASILGATVVSSGNTVSDNADISKVFKFEADAPAEAEPVSEESVMEQIDKLFNPEPEEEDLSEPEAVEESSEPEEQPEQEAEQEASPLPVSVVKRVALPLEQSVVALESVDEKVGKKKNREYTSFAEKDSFIDVFVDSITSIRVRIFAAAFLSLMLLFVENASLFGFNVIRFLHLEGTGGGMAIITLPFIFGLFLLVIPEVVYSFAALAMGKLVPELFLTVSLGVVSIYYGILIAFSVSDSYALVGLAFAVLVVLSMLSSYYKKKAEFATFAVVSAKGEKRVVDRKLTRNLPLEHRALDGVVESYKSRTARVFKTGFVSDFSARSSLISENCKANLLILAISLGSALLCGIVAFFIPGGIVNAAKTFALVYTLSLPSFIFVSHKIPYFRATSEAVGEDSAFIGERALFEYSGIDVITFDDTEIFTKEDVNLQRIMVYGKKENLPKALAQMSALFTVVGGPLAYIFADAVDRRVAPADDVAVDTDGIVGTIDGVEVIAGNASFMERHGIEIPYDPSGEEAPSQSTRIMYAAEGGEIYAKFYVRYMLSEDFTMILPLLLDDKIKPLVYTRDPNVDDLLFRALTAGKDSIRVLKKQNLPSSEVRLYSRVSLGLVSVGDKTNIINSVLLSKRYASFHEKLSLIEVPLVIGGAFAGLLLSLLVKSSIPSLVISLWYVAWSVGVALAGSRLFGRKKEKNKDKD